MGLGGVGCAAQSPPALTVVPASELPRASGRPVITAIDDRGGGDITAVGRVTPIAQDGVAVIGETLLIRGRNFGRQPTVAIAGQAAGVVSRTDEGGIFVRVPAGTPSGVQAVSVTTENGRAERMLPVRRLAVVRSFDGLTWLELGATALAVRGRADVPNARAVVFSGDGRAAFAAAEDGRLHVFELPAAGQPAARGSLELLRPLRALLAPAEAPRLVAIGETELVLVDTTSPLRPVRAAVRPLPAWLRGKGRLRAALSPDGKHLALALADRNRLVVLSIDELRPAHEPRRAELSIVPEVLAPAIADVTFAPDGRTLWLVSGVTSESKALGPQPTRVHAIRVQSSADGTPALTRARLVDLAAATQPVAIVTGRAQPLASGAAIRLPPERALVHVAAYSSTDGHPGVFTIGPDDAATTVLSDRNGGLIGRPEVSADESWLLAPCGDRTSGWKVMGVARAGQGAVTAVPIGTGAAGADGEPRDSFDARSFMEIKVQP